MNRKDSMSSDDSIMRTPNTQSSMRGFLYGYVAGNLQSSSDAIKVHVESIIGLLDKYIDKNNTKSYIELLEETRAYMSNIKYNTSDPINTLNYLTDSFAKITSYFELSEDLSQEDGLTFFKKIIFHFLSIAQRIKSGSFVNLVTEFAERNKSLVNNA